MKIIHITSSKHIKSGGYINILLFHVEDILIRIFAGAEKQLITSQHAICQHNRIIKGFVTETLLREIRKDNTQLINKYKV